ncbi:MAG: phosphate ABC transporter permease subunit PstC [Dehalococcoidales bacterium]|nr:phosphate ABC transporter permease subunit PstC [Dehalococcoidales bacterium]
MASSTPQSNSPGTRWWRTIIKRPDPADWLFRSLTLIGALTIVLVLLAMVVYLVNGAWPAITRFGPGFLISSSWDAVHDKFGALPAIFGTLLTSFIAMIIAVPLSFGVAIFLVELAPVWFRRPASFLVEMLAAIPSVVLGLWALFVMVPFIRDPTEVWLQSALGFLPFFQGQRLGVGFLSGGLILVVMTLPIITAVTREALTAVPSTQREAMLALGATRWEAIQQAVVPYARSGLIAAVILGLGRAIGETMAVTMVIGNGYKVTASLFSPGNTMASKIAAEFAEASDALYVGSLIEIALILFGITLVTNIAGRLLVRRLSTTTRGEQ